MDRLLRSLFFVQMGQADRRRGKGGPAVRNDNGGSQ
jgi:hypothetical protein